MFLMDFCFSVLNVFSCNLNSSESKKCLWFYFHSCSAFVTGVEICARLSIAAESYTNFDPTSNKSTIYVNPEMDSCK